MNMLSQKMSDEGRTRDEIEEVVNDQDPVQEAVTETVVEEGVKPVKGKSKAKSKTKPKTKITKEPVEAIKEEEPEPVVEEKLKKYKFKEFANCPDCGLSMTAHILKYIHKKDIAKAQCKKKPKKKLNKKLIVKEPPGLTKQKPTKTITNITDDIVSTYITEP